MATYAAAIKAVSGLVSLWELGEAAGTFADQKDGNTATARGGTIIRAQASLLPIGEGKGVKLTEGLLNTAKAANLGIGNKGSIEAWVKWEGGAALGKLLSAKEPGFALAILSSGVVGTWITGVGVFNESAKKLVKGNTYHIVVTGNAGVWRTFVNGELWAEEKRAYEPAGGEAQFFFGGREGEPEPVEPVNATIQFVALYNVALTEAQAKRHHEWGVSGPPASVTLTKPPTVGGVRLLNETLKAEPGEYSSEIELFKYQWQRSGSENGPWENITGATGEEYTLTGEDEGKFVRVTVTAVSAGSELVTSSAPTTAIEGFTQSALGEPHGYPDWQPWLAREPIPLYSNAKLVVKEKLTLPTLYVGADQSVDIFLQQTAGEKSFNVILQWHTGPLVAQPIIERKLAVGPTEAEIHQRVPSEADHLTVILEPLAAGGEATFRALIQATESAAGDGRLGNSILFEGAALEVPKEGTLVKTLFRTAPGSARLAMTATGEGTGRTILLEKLNEKGEFVRYLKFVLPEKSGVSTQQIDLPASPVRITLGNTTGAIITVDVVIGVG